MEANQVPASPALEATPTTATPPVEAPKTENTQIDSSRFAALAKKEKAILIAKKELAERERRMQSEVDRYKPYQEIEQLKRTNPLEAMKRMGLSYDELTHAYLNNGQLTPEQIATMKAEEVASQRIDQFQKQQQEQQVKQQQEQYDRALAQIRSDAEMLATSGDTAYSLVKETGAYDTVTQLIEQTFQETGRVMPVEEAMRQTEAQCLEWVERVAKIDKVKSRLLAILGVSPQEQKPAPGTPASQQQTLTHKQTTSPPATKPMTYAERRARAIAIAEGRAPING